MVAILFGAALTIATSYALGALLLRRLVPPPETSFAAGAATLSVLVFLLLLGGVAGPGAFLVLAGIVCTAFVRWTPRSARVPSARFFTQDTKLQVCATLVFGAYGLWYLVNALAPETLPDGIGYHLGLPYEYIRLGRFPSHLAFFDAVPQGMEMLYTMAFAFGRHSAAKLVEFSFLLATVPLMLRIARRLGLSDLSALAVAVFYFCAPVTGITGSSSYTDVAMVFFSLVAFDALLAWRESGKRMWLLPAGLAAGFCYSIKLPGACAVVGACLFVVLQRKSGVRNMAWLAGSAAFLMAPWMVRNFVLTGNPAAPLGNAFFPNPAFHIFMERELATTLASLRSVTPLQLPWELAFGGHLTGIFGPLLWALPVALLAWRRPNARLCLAASAILALPWLSNKGARFLMPGVAIAAFPMAMALPRRAAWAAITIQAVVCWPQLLNLWQPDWIFRLHEFPVRAALRLEPEPDYLARHSVEYGVAKMVEASTPSGARIFSLDAVANAYLAREVTVSWQSAEGDRMTDTLRLATVYADAPLYAWSGSWPATTLRALRFRLPTAHAEEWDISEIELHSAGARLAAGSLGKLSSWPNPWETPLVRDGNLATRWRTWQPMLAGMFFEIDLDRPQPLTQATLLSHTPVFHVPLEIYGQRRDGSWRLLTASPTATPRPLLDLRPEAAVALRQAGFDYLLVPTGAGGHGPIGRDIDAHPDVWGVQRVGAYGGEALFRLR